MQLALPRKGGEVMNYDFSFDHRLRLLRITFSGELNDIGLMEAAQRLREVSVRMQPERVLSDFSAVTKLDIASNTVRSLAHARPAFEPKVGQVIYAPQDHVFGLARMFQAMSAEMRPKIQVVRKLADAYRILGVEEDPKFEPLKVA